MCVCVLVVVSDPFYFSCLGVREREEELEGHGRGRALEL